MINQIYFLYLIIFKINDNFTFINKGTITLNFLKTDWRIIKNDKQLILQQLL